MENKTKIIVVGAVVALIGLVSVVSANVSLKQLVANAIADRVSSDISSSLAEGEDVFGASAGPDYYQRQNFLANYSVGGQNHVTSSAAATFTLTTTELDAEREDGFISWTPNVQQTLTTMASTSAPLVGLAVGESYSVNFFNASSTPGAVITLAAGTGVDLQEDEGGTVTINGGEIARLTFLKKADTDVILWAEVGQIGD